MNKKSKAILRAAAAGATFAVAMGDVVDQFAKQTNHPAWYGHYPLASLVTLNFGEREDCWMNNKQVALGKKHSASGNASVDVLFRKPVDARITLELTDGLTLSGKNVIEEAAELVLQQMRSIATTTAPYSREETANFIRNARSIVAAYSIARRVSGCAGLADAYDVQAGTKYIALGLPDNVQNTSGGTGVETDSIIDNLAAFRAKLGAMTPRIRNLIPANIDLIERTKWLFSNIFVDSPSAKFSAKMFTASNFWIYHDDGSATLYTFGKDTPTILAGSGTEDDPYTIAGMNQTPAVTKRSVLWDDPLAVLGLIEEMIQDMMRQVSTSRIGGDLLKAFGQRAFMEFPDFNPYARTAFVYDEDVLNQIQNLVPGAVGFDINGQLMPYWQSLVADTDSAAAAAMVPSDLETHIVTTYRDTVPPERVLSLTRFQPYSHRVACYRYDTGGPVAAHISKLVTCGTEVPVSYQYVKQLGLNTGHPQTYTWLTATARSFVDATADIVSAWSSDDWAPMAFSYIEGPGFYIVLDAQNWASMNEKDASSYHEIATLSLCLIHELVQKTDTFQFVQ